MLCLLLSFFLMLVFILNFNEFRFLPIFIPFLMIIVSYGIIYFLVNFNTIIIKILILIFLIAQLSTGIYFALDHKRPDTAEQIRQFLFEKERNIPVFTTSETLNQYLKLQGISSTFGPKIPEKSGNKKIIILTEKELNFKTAVNSVYFHHNFIKNPQFTTLIFYKY